MSNLIENLDKIKQEKEEIRTILIDEFSPAVSEISAFTLYHTCLQKNINSIKSELESMKIEEPEQIKLILELKELSTANKQTIDALTDLSVQQQSELENLLNDILDIDV